MGVVHVREAQVDLGEACRAHVGGCAEAGCATFRDGQGRATGQHRDIVGWRDGQVDRTVHRRGAVVGGNGEVGRTAGFRQTTEIHAVDGRVDVRQGAAEADRARAVAGEADEPGGAGEGQGAGGGTEGDGLVVAVAIGEGDAADGDVAVLGAAAGGTDAIGDGRGRQQAVQPAEGEGAGFDGARGGFQRGVATAADGAGEVGGGRHVGAGKGRQAVDEGAALACHVAAVDQNVGAGAEVAADGGKLAAEALQAGGVEALVT